MVEYFVMCTVIPLVGFNLLQNKNYLLAYYQKEVPLTIYTSPLTFTPVKMKPSGEFPGSRLYQRESQGTSSASPVIVEFQ